MWRSVTILDYQQGSVTICDNVRRSLTLLDRLTGSVKLVTLTDCLQGSVTLCDNMWRSVMLQWCLDEPHDDLWCFVMTYYALWRSSDALWWSDPDEMLIAFCDSLWRSVMVCDALWWSVTLCDAHAFKKVLFKPWYFIMFDNTFVPLCAIKFWQKKFISKKTQILIQFSRTRQQNLDSETERVNGP